jgi:hypothetical protein
MKKLLRKLRHRSQGDTGVSAAVGTGDKARKDHVPSIEREGTSGAATRPEGSIDATGAKRKDVSGSAGRIDLMPTQNAGVQKPVVDPSKEQQADRQVGGSRSGLTPGNAAVASQDTPSNLLAPKKVLPPTEIAQTAVTPTIAPAVTPVLRALVESVANSRNVDELVDTIRAQLTPRCSNCYSLDARKIPPDAVENDWLTREYNVAAGTPSRKFSIKHTQLLASSASGCVYCILICKSLSEIRPGWETEESFFEVFVSPNLPVVVRWINGTTITTTPEWEESVGGYIQHEIQLRFAKPSGYIEPHIEFEIYRPELPQWISMDSSLFPSLVCRQC